MRRLMMIAIAAISYAAIGPAGLSAQDATPVTGIGEAVDPALCRVSPRSAEEAHALWTQGDGGQATPAAATDDDWTADVVLSAAPAPLGRPAGAEIVAAVTATVREAYACTNAQDFGRFSALLSDAMVGRLFDPADDVTLESARSLLTPGEPLAEADRTRLIAVTDVSVMDDGRVAALVVSDDPTEPPEGPDTVLLLFVEERGRWVVDGVLEFTDDEALAELDGDGTPTAGDLPGVSGTAYRSPTFGYEVAWDATWSVARSTVAEGQDRLLLSRGSARANFHGLPAGAGTTLPADPAACLQAVVDRVAADPGIAEFGPAPGNLGTPFVGGSNVAGGAYVGEVASQSGTTTAVAFFVSCRALSAEAVLVTTYSVLREAVDEALPLFRALDGSLVLPGDATPPAAEVAASPPA